MNLVAVPLSRQVEKMAEEHDSAAATRTSRWRESKAWAVC